MKLRLLLFCLIAVALAGCQTPYQEPGFDGGVSAAPITNDTYRISARGNQFTEGTTIQDYALLKAAETTLNRGDNYFLILSGSDATQRTTGYVAGTSNTTIVGNTATTTYQPGYQYDIVKPGEDLIIQVVNVPPGSSPPPGAFPAQEVFDNINPRVVRP